MSALRRWVSLGGWCGPSLMLSKQGLRGDFAPLPYDMVRCTMDGMTQFTLEGFDEYFPEATEDVDSSLTSGLSNGCRYFSSVSDPNGKRIPMDPVSIWLLFRGRHTAFTHFDLNIPAVRRQLQDRIDEWHRMMDLSRRREHPPVTFLRTCLAANPADELGGLGDFQAALDEASGGSLDYRIALAVHDQGPETKLLGTAGDHDRVLVWNLALKGNPETDSLFDRAHDGYAQILAEAGDDAAFKAHVATCKVDGLRADERRVTSMFTPNPHIATVEGVPAFRGTCVGFGSTVTAATGTCMACGNTDGHALSSCTAEAAAPKAAAGWTEDDDAALAIQVEIHSKGDLVADVEALAQQLGRDAADVLGRIKHHVREHGDPTTADEFQ